LPQDIKVRSYSATAEKRIFLQVTSLLLPGFSKRYQFFKTEIKFYDENLTPVSREVFPNLAVCCDLGLDNCPHYMLKELREVPDSVRFTERAFEGIKQKLSAILSDVNRAVFVGCGTAYHAAMIGKRYTESFARIPCEAETGGEFRYKQPVIDGRTAVFAISQSGETADTVEAARLALSSLFCLRNLRLSTG